jgi:hypothetical protein
LVYPIFENIRRYKLRLLIKFVRRKDEVKKMGNASMKAE